MVKRSIRIEAGGFSDRSIPAHHLSLAYTYALSILGTTHNEAADPCHEDIIPMKFPQLTVKSDSQPISFLRLNQPLVNRRFALMIATSMTLFAIMACGSDPVGSEPTATAEPTAAAPTATAIRITVTVPPEAPTPDPDPATATPDPTDGLVDYKNLSMRSDDNLEFTEDEVALLVAFNDHWNAAKSGDWDTFLDGCTAGARGDKTAESTADKFVTSLGYWEATQDGFDIIERVPTILSPSIAYVEGYVAQDGKATGTAKGGVAAWLWSTEDGRWLDAVCSLAR